MSNLPDVSGSSIIIWLTIGWTVFAVLWQVVESVIGKGTGLFERLQSARRAHAKTQDDERDEALSFIRQELLAERLNREVAEEAERHGLIHQRIASEYIALLRRHMIEVFNLGVNELPMGNRCPRCNRSLEEM